MVDIDVDQSFETAAGEWKCATTDAQVLAWFAYKKGTPQYKKLKDAFKEGKRIALKINKAVQKNAPETVKKSLYLSNHKEVIKAINGLEGFGQTSVIRETKKGKGTTVDITSEFFQSVLAGLGDIAPMKKFLNDKIGDMHMEAKQHKTATNLGTVFVLVSLDMFGYPTFTVQYVYLEDTSRDWVVQVPCGSAQYHEYNYQYIVVNYIYMPPKKEDE